MSKVTPDRALFLGSYWEAIQELETCEQQNEMFWAIINYQAFGEVPDFEDTILKVMWKLIVPNVDNSVDRYMASIANGKKGGRPKKSEVKPTNNLNKPKKTQDNLKEPEERVGSYWKTQQKLKKEKEKEKEIEKENKIEIDIEKEAEKEMDKILSAKGIFN